ncbi:hypothetical protein D3C80_1087280 [compost metagenome]
MNAARQPGRVGHFDVLRTEDQAYGLDQDQADAPGRQQGFQWPAVEVANHRALQQHADAGRDEERHRQRHQWVERQRLGGQALQQGLHHVGGIGTEHQHLAMGHVDHPEQAESDGQAQRGQQQDRPQRHAAESLTEQLTHQQLALDLGQAGFGCGVYSGVTFHTRFEQVFQAGAGQWITGFTQQAHGSQAHYRVAVDQLQVGQGQAQGGVHRFVGFGRELAIEQGKLRRFGAFLQLLRGRQADPGIGRKQLMAGQGVVYQAAQAVVQAQFLLAQLALLQGIEQVQASGIGLRCPAFQQCGLLAGVGSAESVGVAAVCGQGQQQGEAEDDAVQGCEHRGACFSSGAVVALEPTPHPSPLPKGRGDGFVQV